MHDHVLRLATLYPYAHLQCTQTGGILEMTMALGQMAVRVSYA